MKQETIDKLLKLAQSQARGDHSDFNPCDFSGGNYDDAWYYGQEDGEIFLARKILELEGIPFKAPVPEEE